ncbi:MAG: phosphoenolpyruvate carboxylase, partial [Phycisphaeraceae bacterium]
MQRELPGLGRLGDPREGAKVLDRQLGHLGFELGHILRRHAGQNVFDLVERIRDLAKKRRAGRKKADSDLRKTIATVPADQMDALIRALSCFFDLANLAEDRHRIRVLRHRERQFYPAPLGESIGAAIVQLHQQGFTAEQVQQLVDRLNIELVFTAHPTEAKRRTVRRTLRRLRRDLVELDDGQVLPRERQRLMTRIRSDVGTLWETDAIRDRRPTVIEEVRRGIFLAEGLWNVLPEIYRSLRNALAQTYPDHTFRVPAFLRFGSWIGGDRDGNAFVTADVTEQTFSLLRTAALERHIQACRDLTGVLSISARRHPVSDAVSEKVRHARERWPEVKALIEAI